MGFEAQGVASLIDLGRDWVLKDCYPSQLEQYYKIEDFQTKEISPASSIPSSASTPLPELTLGPSFT